MFDPMSISVSTEKPFCGIISVKKVIELFPAAERIPDSMYVLIDKETRGREIRRKKPK